MVSSLTLLALASGALALKVTSPDSSTIWSTGEKQTIKWDTVSSDESSFNIYLSNMASYPPTNVLLASDVSSDSGSYDVDGSKLADGNSFTINFTNGTKTEQIYAQSNQFNITESTSSSSSSSSSASATASGSSTASSTGADSTGTASSTASGSSTASATATGTSASSESSATSGSSSSSGSSSASGTATGTSSSSSSTSSAGATSGAGKVVASWVGVAALAALAL
ncbi:hypothetical protein Daus18300_003864 [Diaporthe australafricana]|uniref:Yeast cell wall synthesis Kre9/Knh1-like N-terminal domain-containing protein n=1 Tax=Diaporthe australafricana TaxID=127596 RepID=A0ABR3XC21_9PEZI